MAFLLLLLHVLGGAQSPADEALAEALASGNREAVVELLTAAPVLGKRFFARKAEELLRLRLADRPVDELKGRLELLCAVYKEEFNESYLAGFLAAYLSWDKADIEAKLACDARSAEAGRLCQRGGIAQARPLLMENLGTYRRLGHTKGITTTLTLLGWCSLQARQLKEAESLYREALAEALKVRYRTHVLKALSYLGSLYKRQGRPAEAEDAYTQYLTWAQEGRDHKGESRALANLADVAALRGDLRRALSLYGRALGLPGRDRGIEKVIYYGMGAAFHRQRDYLRAFRQYQEALRRAKDDSFRATIWDSLGSLWKSQRDFER